MFLCQLLGSVFLKCVIHVQREQLLELIRLVKLPEAQTLQDFIVGLLSQSVDRFIPCCVERLRAGAQLARDLDLGQLRPCH